MVKVQNKAIFLDRDGVLNLNVLDPIEGERAPRNLQEFKLYEEVETCCKKLKELGFDLYVVTNQPDLATNLINKTFIEEIEKFLISNLGVKEVLVCPHDKFEGCMCRKPNPGMLLKLIKNNSLNPSRCFLVGDRFSDVLAANSVGITAFLINGRSAKQGNILTGNYMGVNSLSEAVEKIHRIETQLISTGIVENYSYRKDKND